MLPQQEVPQLICIADSTEDAASGLDKTNDNAKKLQKSLSVLSFDELNQLNDAKVSNSSSSSGDKSPWAVAGSDPGAASSVIGFAC